MFEALVFATDEPLSAQDIRSLILDEPTVKTSAEPDVFSEPTPATGGELTNGAEPAKRKKANLLELSVIKDAIRMLNNTYEESGRTFRIIPMVPVPGRRLNFTLHHLGQFLVVLHPSLNSSLDFQVQMNQWGRMAGTR